MCNWCEREVCVLGTIEKQVQLVRERDMSKCFERESCAIGAVERRVQLVRQRGKCNWSVNETCPNGSSEACAIAARERERERERRVQFVRGKVCNLKEHCPGIIGSAVILTHMLESNWSGGFGSFNCFLFVVFCLSFVFFTIFLAFLSIGCVLACACHTMQLILSRMVSFL